MKKIGICIVLGTVGLTYSHGIDSKQAIADHKARIAMLKEKISHNPANRKELEHALFVSENSLKSLLPT